MTRVLEEAIQRGIVIVNITQCTPPFPPGIPMDVILIRYGVQVLLEVSAPSTPPE